MEIKRTAETGELAGEKNSGEENQKMSKQDFEGFKPLPHEILGQIRTLQMLLKLGQAGSQLKAKADQGGPISSFSYTQIKRCCPCPQRASGGRKPAKTGALQVVCAKEGVSRASGAKFKGLQKKKHKKL